MARFTAQGRLKPFLNNDGITIRFECKLGSGGGLRFADGFSVPIQLQKRKLRSSGCCKSSSRMHASSSSAHKSSCVSESKQFNKESGETSASRDEPFEEIMEDDPEFEKDDLACFRGLVLDISYRPVNVVCWKRAICLEFMEKVPHLLQVVKRRRVNRNLSRKNIFYRDNFTCQGGEWTWQNLVTACAKCNSKKGHRTLEEANMKLLKVPNVYSLFSISVTSQPENLIQRLSAELYLPAPKDFEILAIPLTSTAIKTLRMRKGIPEEWLQYLSMP